MSECQKCIALESRLASLKEGRQGLRNAAEGVLKVLDPRARLADFDAMSDEEIRQCLEAARRLAARLEEEKAQLAEDDQRIVRDLLDRLAQAEGRVAFLEKHAEVVESRAAHAEARDVAMRSLLRRAAKFVRVIYDSGGRPGMENSGDLLEEIGE